MEMFRVACGLRERGCWEISPSEFWRMSPAEWWGVYEANIGRELAEHENAMARARAIYYGGSK